MNIFIVTIYLLALAICLYLAFWTGIVKGLVGIINRLQNARNTRRKSRHWPWQDHIGLRSPLVYRSRIDFRFWHRPRFP